MSSEISKSDVSSALVWVGVMLLMVLPPAFRPLAPVLLIFLFARQLFAIQRRRNAPLRGIEIAALVAAFALLLSALIKSIVDQVYTDAVFYYFLPPIMLIVASLSLREASTTDFLRAFSIVALFVGFVLFLELILTGRSTVSSLNYIGGFFLVGSFYFAFCKRWVLLSAISIFSIFVSVQTEARLALAGQAVLVAAALAPGRLLTYFTALIVALAAACSVFYAFNWDARVNDVLTNRVYIWNVYGRHIADKPIFGHTGTSRAVAADVADSASAFARRGVNETYSTQNMFLRYTYEDGFLGLFVVVFLLVAAALANAQVAILLSSLIATCFIEGIKLGVPSFWGVPLTLAVIMAARPFVPDISGRVPRSTAGIPAGTWLTSSRRPS